MFFNPCKCECQKEIIRSQLIVIVKQFSPTKKKSMSLVGNINKVSTVAMQPKHMQVKKQNMFKEKPEYLFQSYEILGFKQKSPVIQAINNDPIYSMESAKIQQTSKTLSIKNSQQIFVNKQNTNQKQQVKQKLINSSSEDETQRKTFKKYNNSTNPKNHQNTDIVLTTKRCKKKQSINLIQSPNLLKNNLPQIDEVIIKIRPDQQNKENQPNGILLNESINKSAINENKSTQMMKLMNDEIMILKNQLKRLQNDEKCLLFEKNQNEKFFQQDFAINQKKKQNLKRNCQQRSEELKELKQLLIQCRDRKN